MSVETMDELWTSISREVGILTFMNDEKRFFVYVDYTTEPVARPYYVGKGVAARVRNLRARNKLHANISEKYGFERKCVLEFVTEREAFDEEVRLIAELKTYYYGGIDHWGCNFTRGGDGSVGHHQPPITDEHREILRKVNSHPKTDETRMKMKEAAQKRANDPQWIEKMKLVSKERWKNEEYRELHRQQTTGKRRTLEQRAHFSEAQKLSWSDNEKRERLSEGVKRRFTDPEERKRISEKLRELWKDPDYREKMMKARKNRKKEQ